MEPFEIALSLELGSVLIAVVGAIGTWIHHRHQKALLRQRERHHRDLRRMEARRRLAAPNGTTDAAGSNGHPAVVPATSSEL